jgi:hypothetical protein
MGYEIICSEKDAKLLEGCFYCQLYCLLLSQMRYPHGFNRESGVVPPSAGESGAVPAAVIPFPL